MEDNIRSAAAPKLEPHEESEKESEMKERLGESSTNPDSGKENTDQENLSVARYSVIEFAVALKIWTKRLVIIVDPHPRHR